MAENVPFNPYTGTIPQPPSVPPVPPAPPVLPVPPAPPVSPTPPVQTIASPPKPATTSLKPAQPPVSHSSLSTLIKVAAALFVLLILVGAALFYLLPLFTSSSSGKVTLVYWGIWEDKKVMQPLIDAFEKQYPNITIDYEEQDIKQLLLHNQAYPKLVVSRINAGNGPDIFCFHNTWYPMFSTVLAPFTQDVMSTQDYTNTFFPVVTQDLVHNGAIYGVPLSIDTLALYVNPEIFQSTKVPTDWNDFYATAKDLTVKSSDGTITTAGAAMGTMDNVAHASDIVGLLLADSDVTPSTIGDNSDIAGKALLYYTNFANSTGAIWNDNLPPSLQMFAQGNLAMYIGYSWDIYTIRSLNPNLKFVVQPMPTLYGTKRTLANYWAEGVSVKSKHPKEAMLFMKYLTQKETAQLFYTSAAKVRGFGEPYARGDLADSLKSNKLLYPFVEQGSDAISSVFVDDTFDDGINTQSTQALKSAIKVTGASSTADVGTLSTDMTKVFQQYGQ